ncbi:MAG: hypothetical protein KC653_00255 [Candidatus Andersenbacteria bacterium]|nr:hypothetical protein [Candidatus Andersenbacteria bacterium]
MTNDSQTSDTPSSPTKKVATDITPPRPEKIARKAPEVQKRDDKRELKAKAKEERIRLKSERSAVRGKKNAEKSRAKQDKKIAQQEEKTQITKVFPSKTHWKYFPVMLRTWERRTLFAAGFLVAIGLVLAVIGAGRTYLTALPQNGGDYVEGVLGQPETVNPILLAKDADRDLAQLMYSGLMRYDSNQELQPDLAESYEVSEDGKNYTFTLRQDALWHDGEQVTADDIVFTVQLMKDPEVKSPRQADFQSVAVEKLDDFTVKFTLTKDAFVPFLRENTTFGILPKHIWQDVTPAQIPLADENLQVIGSGPFLFKQFRRDTTTELITSYELERNKDFYGQVPYLDTFTFKYYSNSEKLLSDFEKGRIDGIHTLSPAQRAALPENKLDNWNIMDLELPSYFALFFNQTKNEALKELEVRQALGASLDRQRIVDEALNGAARVTNAPILPSFLGFNPEVAGLEHDDAHAAELLDGAGWTLNEGNSFRTKDDQTLTIEVVMPDHDPFPRIAGILTEEWEALGIEVNIVALDSALLRTERIRPRNYQTLLFGQSVAHDPDPYPFWHSTLREDPGLNLTSYKNPTVDDLLETARKEANEDERVRKYVHFQNELAEDLPAIFLYIPTYTYALDTDVKGVDMNAVTFPSDRLADANFWYRNVKWRPAPQEESEEATEASTESDVVTESEATEERTTDEPTEEVAADEETSEESTSIEEEQTEPSPNEES